MGEQPPLSWLHFLSLHFFIAIKLYLTLHFPFMQFLSGTLLTPKHQAVSYIRAFASVLSTCSIIPPALCSFSPFRSQLKCHPLGVVFPCLLSKVASVRYLVSYNFAYIFHSTVIRLFICLFTLLCSVSPPWNSRSLKKLRQTCLLQCPGSCSAWHAVDNKYLLNK